jgi:molybdopterin/thiamine biosynthesis adenylyltransferase
MDDSRLSFLGAQGLGSMRDSSVAVVGCGGGGSHIIQHLAHLGIGTIQCIDPDILAPSNLNRVVGAMRADLYRPKAEIMTERFAWTQSRLGSLRTRVQDTKAIQTIQSSDCVFGAVDSFRTRDDIDRACRQALVPYIDIGLGIIVEKCRVISAAGQIVLSAPGGPCLRCMDVVTEETLARDREEYMETGAPEQQVISMNAVLAGEAVTTFLALITGFAGGHVIPRYIVYNALLHEMAAHPFFGSAAPECPHYPLGDAGDRIAGE